MQGTCIMRGGPRHLHCCAAPCIARRNAHVQAAPCTARSSARGICSGAQGHRLVAGAGAGRLHAVRGKGKSAFLVVRQGGAGATVQAVMFVDDKTVSKVRDRRLYLVLQLFDGVSAAKEVDGSQAGTAACVTAHLRACGAERRLGLLHCREWSSTPQTSHASPSWMWRAWSRCRTAPWSRARSPRC